MQFLYPTFLFALAALAIPIIIHLFHFRRFKRVYFTNVRFLKEVKEETSARSKLRNLLVLMSRLLAILFLVLAFAQPFIPRDVEVQKGQKNVSVYIDNSFSMSALSSDVALVEKAKQRAQEVVQAYREDDRFQVLTNDFEGRHQRLVGKEEAIELIDEVEISPAVRQLSNVISRQQRVLDDATNGIPSVYLISDFQKNTTDLETFQDTSLEVNLVPLQAVRERNISIDSVWFEAPVQMMNQTNAVVIQIRNLSEEDVENIRLSLKYEGQTKPVGTLNIPARSSALDTVNITILRNGWHEAVLNITDYPVQFDDQYYFTFYVSDNIRVLAINENLPNRFVDAAFNGIPYFSVDNRQSQNLDYSQFGDYQMILLNDLSTISSGLAFELKSFMENGGNVLVFPAKGADISSYRSFLNNLPANEILNYEEVERQVTQVNTEEFVFKNVFENRSSNLKLPNTLGRFKTNKTSSRLEEPLLIFRDGSSFISKYQIGEGNFYFSTTPLNEDVSDLVRNGEVFIPMLYKMAISSAKQNRVAYTIGKDEVIEKRHKSNSSDLVYKIRQKEGGEFIPGQRVIGSKVFFTINDQVKEAGFYEWFLNEEESLGTIAFNYDREESDLTYLERSELEALAGDRMSIIDINENAALTARIEERSQGLVLWRLCLILALVFLAVEILLLRFWKV
jgi:hypothetical protein